MLMDVSAGGGGGSDFDALESDELPPPKTTARGKKTATKAAAKAPAKKAPAKKAPAKGRGKKAVQVGILGTGLTIFPPSNSE